MSEWYGLNIQEALLRCEVVEEDRVTEVGPGKLYHLKLGKRLVPLGIDGEFAKLLQFALVRNAQAFEGYIVCEHEWAPFVKHPEGGHDRVCKKCGVNQRSDV